MSVAAPEIVTSTGPAGPSPQIEAAPLPPVTAAPWILPVRAVQVAVWEIAALAVLLAFGSETVSQPARIVVASLAGLTVLLSSVRVAGRHFAGWTVIWLGYRLRRHADRRGTGDPLEDLAGEVQVRQHVDRAGNRFGVAEVDDGWTCVVRLTDPGAPDHGALLDVLRWTYRRTDIPLASAQLMVWTMPRKDAPEPFRVYWLAVRYRPSMAPIAAVARGGGELGSVRTASSAALGLMGGLAEAGYQSTVLEAGELTEELRLALGTGTVPVADSDQDQDSEGRAADSATQPGPAAEAWRAWTAGDSTHTCFTPLTTQLPLVLDAHSPSAAFTATSVTLRRNPAGRERTEVAIRVGTRTGEDPATAADLGIAAAPVHGRHADHARRTLPLALTN